jgi:eukaryotic-like serine/threonine-protein kinase
MNDDSSRDVVIFEQALCLPEAERAGHVKRASAGDADMRHRVEVLLRAFKKAGNFLQEPAPGLPGGLGQPAAKGERPGDWIGRYKLLEQIGEGGHGVVFMAEQQEPVRRRTALKIIKPGMDTKSVIARFEAERQALALMDHPNIAKIFDADATDSGRPYFVMELIRGVKITQYCDHNSLTTAERLELFIQVCHAIQHAHQKGVIHRDIKPSNILVTTTIEGAALPVVIDFGIAKATTNQRLTNKTFFTAFEMLIGTPAYMSPEQAALTSVDVDTRTDIYSLGVLLYELLTGLTPFDTGELLKAGLDETRRVIREQEPLRPSTRLSKMAGADLTATAQSRKTEPPKLIRSINGDLDWIAMKALEKDRTRRYETANGLALDVQRYLAGEPISARPPSTLYKFQKTFLRNKVLFAGLGIIALLMIISLITVSASLARERQARREADAALRQAETDNIKAGTALRQAEADKLKAEAETAKSRQVTLFLKEMLQGVGPSVARGRDTTMLQEIMDRTAERLGHDLTNQPEVEADLSSLIGTIYFHLGNYQHAEEMHRAALTLNQKLFGPESPEVAGSLNDLGRELLAKSELPEADGVVGQALAIRRRLFGDENVDTATSLNDLGSVYMAERRIAESEVLIRQALGIRRKLFGNESLEVADSLHNLCVILGDEGRRAESETNAEEELVIRRQLLGSNDVSVASALLDVAWGAGWAGNLDKEQSSYEDALKIQRKLLGDWHPYVMKSVAQLGENMRKRGNLPEAHAVLITAISVQRKILGDDHPDTLASMGCLGRILEAEGNWAEAESVNREALNSWRKRSGNEDEGTLWESEQLARDLTAQNKLGDAEQVLNDALTPESIRKPASADLLFQRITLAGRRRQWQKAAADAAIFLEDDPKDPNRFHMLAGLFAMTHHRTAYEGLCQTLLPMFADATNCYVAERTAADCLLLPDTRIDLKQVDKLADTAVVTGSKEFAIGYFQACKALSEYRQGRFSGAAEWAEKSSKDSSVFARAKGFAVLAMSQWQLGRKDEARTALARGNALMPRILPSDEHVDLGESWVAWLFSRVALDEAGALIQPPLTSENRASELRRNN